MKRFSASAILFASLLATAVPAAQRTFDLRAPALAFSPAPAAGENGATGGALLRAAEAPAADAGVLAPGDAVTLLLFDGDQVDLVVEEASATTFSGSRAFLARTKGSALLDAVILVDADGLLHARIQGLGEGRVLRIFPRDGATAVEESEPAPIEEDEDAPAAPAPELAPAPAAEGGEPLPGAAQQSDTIVDVLVGFDLHAKAWAENNGGTTNFAETAVQNMNLALANSNLDGYFRFRLAGVAFVNAWESGVRKAYDRYGVGEWAVMGSAAAACGADVVTVLIDTGGDSGTTGCGKAFTSTSQTSFNAVNVCAIRAVAIGETMTHECGHNLGCGHANTAGASDPGPQSFPYSSGYHFTGSDGVKYHTIMAYNWLEGESGTYKLANVFSSPDLTHAGVPAGTADANDNRRVLTQTGAWASHWRTAVRPVTYDVFFTPASETAISGSLRVTLEPGRSGLPIRYTTDGSAPTLQSALYSGPITLTGTTTIRAATVYEGALGPVCTARYFVPDLSEALDTPGLAWTTSSYRPFTFQTTNTWDGSDAVQSTSDAGGTIEATIVGPTSMSFRYRSFFRTDDYPVGNIAEKLVVLVDNQSVWSASPEGSPSNWLLGEAAIPSGSHTVRFAYQQNGGPVVSLGGRTYGVWLDNIRFDALSRPPALSPATTDSESTAAAFTGGSRTISISAPGGDGTLIRYTTDGSDPMKDGIPYEGPFTISASTRVRAVAIEAGRDPSVETAGLYLERHRPVRPGEWTADATGLPADAAADSSARLILGLYSTAGMNTACANFRGIVEDPAFTSWCAANGVYLLVSDTTVRPDGALAKPVIVGWANRLESGTPVTGPALVAVTPDGTTTKAADLTFGSGDAFGSKTYQGTVDSLIACLAALLGKTPPSAPTATPDGELGSGFPVSVSLANPNSSGTIRYTLDGSIPTRASAAWTGSPIQIQAGQVLSAAVFPTDSAGLTSTILRRHYRTIPGFFGIPDDAFDWNAAAGDYPWRQHTLASEPTLRSGNNGADQYGPTYRSVLRAVARAAGTLSFSFGDITYIYNTSVFTAPDGTPTSLKSPTTASIEWKAISVDVEPGDVLLWTRDVTYANLEFEAYDFGSHTAHCGAYLRNLVWTPADQPPVPTAPTIGSVSVSDVTTSGATVSVPVTDLGVDSSSVTVKVVVNGVERTQTLSAPGTATFVFSDLEPGTSYTAAVTATGSNGLSSTDAKTFTTEALPSVGWFDVKWASDGYGAGTAWWNAAAERTSGGRWTRPAGDASARSGSALELALPAGSTLRFTAVSPTAAGGIVTVDGTLSPALSATPPEVPSGAFAALCFARGGYKAWNGTQWIALSGATPAASATPWRATFDFSVSPPRVRYAVGGATLSASGSEWIPLATSGSYLSGVGYAGAGSVGDFKASYAGGGFVAPVLCTAEDGHVPLSFGKDGSNNPTFEVTIRNAAKDAWYTVYAADAVGGPYKAVTSAKATADGLKTLSIPAPSTKPARFVRIGVSGAQVPANTEL